MKKLFKKQNAGALVIFRGKRCYGYIYNEKFKTDFLLICSSLEKKGGEKEGRYICNFFHKRITWEQNRTGR